MRKSALVLLVASLVANAVLLYGTFSSPRVDDISVAGSAPLARSVEPESGMVDVARPGRESGGGPVPLATWSAIESDNYGSFRDHLRAAGFPEPYVRALVWQRIRRAHRPEMIALIEKHGERPYWYPRDDAADRELGEGEKDLDRAMRDEFKEYFERGMGEDSRARQARERLPFLPPEKAEEVTRITDDYNELVRKVRSEMSGFIQLDEDQQKMALLEQERRADLATVLSPEELELYDLHTSRTAMSMRSRLTYFEATESEFRTIFALQRTFDEEYGTGFFGMPSQTAMRARADAQTELNRQIAAALGPDRFAEYERASSYSYMTAVKITDHFKLPRENAAAVFALESEYRRRAQEIMRASPDRESAAAAAQAMAKEASTRVVGLLGEEGAVAYRDSAGTWLRNLERQAQRSTTVKQP